MNPADLVWLAWSAVTAQRLRSALTALGIVIGVALVVLLTSIGEGARTYVLAEFTQFGTNVLAVNPGKALTTGQPGALAATVRKLTLEDARALQRLPEVQAVVPMVFGTARVEYRQAGRSVFIYGVNHHMPDVWKFRPRLGRFLPAADATRDTPVAALGTTLKRELFGSDNPLGRHVRIGGRRFTVVGIMEPKGRFLGFDLDDAAYVPVASAMALFNKDGLDEIDAAFSPRAEDARVEEAVRRLLIERHGGEEDFTITTQTEMLQVMGRVLRVLSLAVGAIGGISLLVGGIGILTIMWIAVNERTREIGLLKALGATPGQILWIFLSEAALLSVAGGLAGTAAGLGGGVLLRLWLPQLPVHTPLAFLGAAVGTSLAIGVASGILPARRAAALEPLEALRAE